MKSQRQPGLLLGITDGCSLEDRILRLLEGRSLWARPVRRVAAIACLSVMGFGAVGTTMLSVRASAAQTSQGTVDIPAFDAVTVKPTSPDEIRAHIGIGDGASFNAINYNLRDLIKFVYDLNQGSDDQIVGGPDWTKSAKFDINTKQDAAALAALSKLHGPQWFGAIEHQTQRMLADRFKLKMHRETREMQVYELVVAKDVPRMKPDDGSGAGPKPRSTGINGRGPGVIEGVQCRMDLLVHMLAMQRDVGHLVIDKTGLTGSYDFTLRWSAQPENTTDPSLVTALEEQLGLKLQWTKAPVEVWVIDQAEMPSAN